MYSNLVPWVRKPFTILSNPDGYVGDRMYTASYLGLSDVASFTIERALGVSHTLALVQSDYWVESVTDTLSFSQTLVHNKLRPLSASSTMALTSDMTASGGHTGILQPRVVESCGLMYAGQPVYIKANGVASLADADNTAEHAGVAGIVYGDVTTPMCGPATIITDGELELDDWTNVVGSSALTPGASYYLSTIAGYMSTTPPSGDQEYVVKVGRAISTRIFAVDLGEGVLL